MPKRRNRFIDWISYLAVRSLICVIQAINIETCQQLARVIAVLAYDVLRLRRKVSDDNLAKVFPDRDLKQRQLIARRMWEHLLLMVCEIAQAPRKIHEYSFRNHVVFQDKKLFLNYLMESRPVVLVTGHYGNFELAGYCAALFGFPSFTIARKMDNPYLHQFIATFRQAKGQFLLDKDGCAPQVQTILDHNGTLALLGDQHAGHRGIQVDFLGRPASSNKAVALFTLTSGAPQIVCYLQRTDGPLKFYLGVSGIADPREGGDHLESVRSMTEWYNQRLGEAVLQAPDQYWWVHRRWKEVPPRKKKKKKKLAAAAA